MQLLLCPGLRRTGKRKKKVWSLTSFVSEEVLTKPKSKQTETNPHTCIDGVEHTSEYR